MMNTKGVIAIVAIIVIVAVGGYWFLTSEAGNEFGEIQTEFGTMRTDILVTFVDGSQQYMSADTTDSMTVYFEGMEVWQAAYQIYATATSDDFDGAEVDLSNVQYNMDIYPDGGGTNVYEEEVYGTGIQTLTLDVEKLLMSHVIYLNPVFSGAPAGDYHFIVSHSWNDDESAGFLYRGTPDGTWKHLGYSTTAGLGLLITLTNAEGEILIDWASGITWN